MASFRFFLQTSVKIIIIILTGGWPSSYCGNGNDWNYNTPTAFCDNNLCSSDCQNLGQNGGYCEKDKCFCFKQVYKPKIQASSATIDNSVDSA